MKTYPFIVLIGLLMVISCGNADEQVRSATQILSQTRKADTSQITVVKEYFSNGSIKSEIEAKGSLRHGKTKNYDRYGHLISEVTFANNNREGLATNYYPSGKMSSTLNYKNNIKQGDEIWYYESGKPYRVTPYINGKSNGIQKFYYENSKLMAEVPYKNGNPGVGLKEYNKDGSLVTDYPRLIIQQKDYIEKANKVIITVKLSKPETNFKLFRGTLDEGKYLPKGLLMMAMRDGSSQLDINVPPGTAVRQTEIITAQLKTKFGNPLILTKKWYVSAVNNN